MRKKNYAKQAHRKERSLNINMFLQLYNYVQTNCIYSIQSLVDPYSSMKFMKLTYLQKSPQKDAAICLCSEFNCSDYKHNTDTSKGAGPISITYSRSLTGLR